MVIVSKILKQVVVMGRVSSEQKARVVMKLQNMGHKVCMSGDGANDCTAIKQADLGYSFQSTEASVSAPFINTTRSLKGLLLVLAEARSHLQTNIEVLKFLTQALFIDQLC